MAKYTKIKKRTLANSKGGKTTITHSSTTKRVAQTKAGKKKDRKTKALPAGKRVSASGNKYTERRSNRSDKR